MEVVAQRVANNNPRFGIFPKGPKPKMRKPAILEEEPKQKETIIMKMKYKIAAGVIGAAFFSIPAWPHHAFSSEFDVKKPGGRDGSRIHQSTRLAACRRQR
jgi:hypothetical protein